MNATINSMELVKADSLQAFSLEVGDLIGYENDIVEVIDIVSDNTGDNYFVNIINDFGEEEFLTLAFDEPVDLFVMVE